MIQRVPHYYKAFHCIASDCRDNCCVGGWEIDIDEETAQYYLSMEGEFGDRLRNKMCIRDRERPLHRMTRLITETGSRMVRLPYPKQQNL